MEAFRGPATVDAQGKCNARFKLPAQIPMLWAKIACEVEVMLPLLATVTLPALPAPVPLPPMETKPPEADPLPPPPPTLWA